MRQRVAGTAASCSPSVPRRASRSRPFLKVQLKADDASGPFRIDLEGLQERIRPLPVKPGNLFHLKAGRGFLAWAEAEGWDDSVQEEVFTPRGQDKWKLNLYDLAAKKSVVLNDPVADWSFSSEGRQLLVRRKGALHVGEAAALFGSKTLPPVLDLDRLSTRVVPREEWKQEIHSHGELFEKLSARFEVLREGKATTLTAYFRRTPEKPPVPPAPPAAPVAPAAPGTPVPPAPAPPAPVPPAGNIP